MENQFSVGDLVWAKADRHPWWPGLIYHESLTSPEARQAKKKGCVLVSFFADYSYKWINPKKLIKFESNYSVYSNRSSSHLFMKAINEAVYEVIHRGAIGMTCPCEYFASYRPSRVEGLLEVDLAGYQSGGVYTVQQIEQFRQEFRPVETLSFVQQLALDPTNLPQDISFVQQLALGPTNVPQDINSSKEVARLLAFRKARYAEVDEPYFLSFGVTPPIRPSRDPVVASNNQDISLFQDPREAEIPCKNKPKFIRQKKTERPLARLNDKVDAGKPKNRMKRYGRHDSNTTNSQDHVPQKKREAKFEVKKKLDNSEDKIQSSPSPFKEPSISNAGSYLQQEETTVTPPHDPVTSRSASVCRIQRLSDEIHTRYWQQKGESCVKVNQTVDISEKMLYLLNKCSRIVLESKGF